MSLSARAASLALPVAKTRIGAGELTVTLALCRAVALHGPSCRSGCVTYLMLQFLFIFLLVYEKMMHKLPPMGECAPASTYMHQFHPTNTHTHTFAHVKTTLWHTFTYWILCSLASACSQMERGSPSFFFPVTYFLVSPLRFFFPFFCIFKPPREYGCLAPVHSCSTGINKCRF